MCQQIRFFSEPAVLFGRPLWGTSEKTEKQAGRSDRRDEGSKPTRRARVRSVTETQGEKHLPRGNARCGRVRMPNDPAARQPLLEGHLDSLLRRSLPFGVQMRRVHRSVPETFARGFGTAPKLLGLQIDGMAANGV